MFNSLLIIINLALMLMNYEANNIAIALFNAFTIGVAFSSQLAEIFYKDAA